MAEEADGEVGLAEDVEGLDLPEDVGVLVDGRAVGDGERVVDEDRALGQALQPLQVRLGELAPRPERRLQGHPVEELALLDAVADEVAEEDALVPGLAADEREDGGEGFLVRVDVRQDQVLHPSVVPPPSLRPRRAASAMTRATASGVVRVVSTVTSASA